MISEVGRLKLAGGAILAASAMTLAAVSPAFATSYEDLEDKTETTVESMEDIATTVLTDEEINKIEKEESDAHKNGLFEGVALDVTFEAEAGSLCTLTVTNQHSVHSDTLVKVVSGEKAYYLKDVESAADKVTESDVIVLEENTKVYVVAGPSGYTSLKASDVSCEAPEEAPVAKPIVKKPTYTG